MYKKILVIILLFIPLAPIFAADCPKASSFTKEPGDNAYRWVLPNTSNDAGWNTGTPTPGSRYISRDSIFSPTRGLVVYFYKDKVFCDYNDHGLRLISYKKPDLAHLPSDAKAGAGPGGESYWVCDTATAGEPEKCAWSWLN